MKGLYNITMKTRELAIKAHREWFAYQDEFELETALNIVEKIQPKVILEIGVAHGASLAAWAEVSGAELVIALDPEDIPRTPEQQASYDTLAEKYNFQRIKRYDRDHSAMEELEKILDGRKIDFLFIDGAHGFDDVKFDFYEYKKFMKPEGVVGFHDIYTCEVLEDAGSTIGWFWDRLKKRYDHSEIYHRSSMGIGFIYLGKPERESPHAL